VFPKAIRREYSAIELLYLGDYFLYSRLWNEINYVKFSEYSPQETSKKFFVLSLIRQTILQVTYMSTCVTIYCMALGTCLKIKRKKNYRMEISYQDLRNVKFRPLNKNVTPNFMYYKYLKVT